MGEYATWEARWADFLKERTYPKAGVQRPKWVKPSQKWWYTHISLRRVQGLYRHLIRDQSLFTWLAEAYQQDEKSTEIGRASCRERAWSWADGVARNEEATAQTGRERVWPGRRR